MRRLRLLVACLTWVLSASPVGLPTDMPAISAVDASPTDTTAATTATSPYSVLQMNLCSSGLAGCLRYPAAVREATRVIERRRPSAVTLNEVCSGDIARIARRAGYHRRFATVMYGGAPLRCRNPAGRGLFGNAVLARSRITNAVDRPFRAQSVDPEQRRWLCVATARRVTVCTTHLSARSEPSWAGRRQCAELATVLAARSRRGPTVAAGDVNQRHSCAADGMWTRTDGRAARNPGIQHAYGSRRHLLRPVTRVVPAAATDHDFLLVTARLVRPR